MLRCFCEGLDGVSPHLMFMQMLLNCSPPHDIAARNQHTRRVYIRIVAKIIDYMLCGAVNRGRYDVRSFAICPLAEADSKALLRTPFDGGCSTASPYINPPVAEHITRFVNGDGCIRQHSPDRAGKLFNDIH